MTFLDFKLFETVMSTTINNMTLNETVMAKVFEL